MSRFLRGSTAERTNYRAYGEPTYENSGRRLLPRSLRRFGLTLDSTRSRKAAQRAEEGGGEAERL